MWCQHFQNPKAPRSLGRSRWNSARIFCGSGNTTSRKRNFEFRPLRRAGEMIDPERDDYFSSVRRLDVRALLCSSTVALYSHVGVPWYSSYKRRRFENRSDQTFCILLIKDVLSANLPCDRVIVRFVLRKGEERETWTFQRQEGCRPYSGKIILNIHIKSY